MSTLTKQNLNIEEIVQQIEATPGPSQKLNKAFQTLAQQMQQSGDQGLQSWGSQLQMGTPQVVKAVQQS